MDFPHVARLYALNDIAYQQGISINEMRQCLFTVGNRVCWINNDGTRVFLYDEIEERSAVVESIEPYGRHIAVAGYLATLHLPANVRVVAKGEISGNVECEVFERPDLALACTDSVWQTAEARNDATSSLPNFIPVGFKAHIPKERTRFWIDAGGASSPLTLSFAPSAPLTNENKSFAIIGGQVITCPGKHTSLAMTTATPISHMKRIAALRLQTLSSIGSAT